MGAMRIGNKSLETVVRTDERYGHDGLWLGPRGRDYGMMLEDPKPYQHANLYPDPNSTYWFAIMEMPAGSLLTLKGRFPHGRYLQYALYRSDPLGGFTATGEAFVDNQIQPDPGSTNPFVPGADRRAENRAYSLTIANVDAPEDPADREPNTLYAGVGNKIQIVYRVYLPDVGCDGSGDVGLPTYTATLADGTELSADDVRSRFNQPLLQGVAPGMPVAKWRALCESPDNDPALTPETTPARNPAVLERYFNNTYSLISVFKSPAVRATVSHAVETGFGGDPITLFLMGFVSRRFGPLLVIRGKMPTFPDTFKGQDGGGLEVMTDWQSRYWSVIMSEAPPSGMGADALTDMQVPLDADRNYTIVVCRPDDRPANATDENGVAWMDWGTRGEGLDDEKNRTDFGLILFRFMYNNPEWANNPDTIVEPGTEAEVMGPYFPRLSYTTTEDFEAQGPLR
jgi:hypothetical protein